MCCPLRLSALGSRGLRGDVPWGLSQPLGQNTSVAFGFPGNVLLPSHRASGGGRKSLVPDMATQKGAGRNSESDPTSNEPILRGS